MAAFRSLTYDRLGLMVGAALALPSGLPAYSAGPIVTVAQLAPTASESTDDLEERVSSITDEVDRLQRRFDTIQQSYKGTGGSALTYDLKKRYDEALYLYLIEDYDRAALLFFTIVDRSNKDSFAQYQDAQFYLAENLFLNENYFPALEFYDEIRRDPGHPYRNQALVRMVETYNLAGMTEKFEAFYQAYMSQSSGLQASDKIEYALGKTLYRRRDYVRARALLEPLMAAGGEFAPMAHYLVAASYVGEKNYDKAIELFTSLHERSVNTPEQREMEELAWLGLGRLYLEKKDYDKALESYRSISRYSKHFTEALYEMAQTWYRKGDIDQAIRTIDILLLTSPDSIEAPKLKLMRGHLLQKMNNYNEALDTYERLIAEYTSTKDELDALMKDRSNVLKYFEELVSSDLSRIDSDMMVPQLAVRYATEDKLMARALDITRGLREEEADLLEADRLIADIEEAVVGKPPYDIVLSLKRLRAELRQIQDKLMIGEEQLVATEYRYLEKNLPAAERRRMEDMGLSLDVLPQLARELPQMERDRTELIEVYEDQIQEIDRNLYKIEKLIEDLQAQTAAIEKYLSYSRTESSIDPDTEQSTRQRLGQERDELSNSLQELEAIRRELQGIKVRDELMRMALRREDRVRADASVRMGEYRQALKPLRASVDASDSDEFFAQVDATHQAITTMLAGIQAFYKVVDELEVQELARIQRELAAEKARLSEYALQVQAYNQEARTESEQIAFESFYQIQREFSDLILDANVGIITVYWEQKEAKDREIEQLQTERSEGIRMLQEQFSSLKANEQ